MKDKARELLEKNGGILQLVPCWVPRKFNEPGRRLRLHPDDYYAYGMKRGGICERWLGSVTAAMNGPDADPREGMSRVLCDRETGETVLLADAVRELGEELIGKELYEKYGTWPAFSKLYDYDRPLFHHLHLTSEKAERIGRQGKPEAYYFPVQYNASLGRFPLTYFGFDPSVTKEEVKDCIRDFDNRDTRITELSRAYRIQLGTGWYTPAGVIHAPASVVTYEPQWNSDVNIVMENVTMGEINDRELLSGCMPQEEKDSVDKIFETIDWEESTRPDYKETYFRRPLERENAQEGISEKWVAYANEWIAAKEVTIEPGCSAVLRDSACYCALVVQGYGSFASFTCEAPLVLRFGQPSADEFFVSERAAREGIEIQNCSECEPMVILQNFANNNKEVPGR